MDTYVITDHDALINQQSYVTKKSTIANEDFIPIPGLNNQALTSSSHTINKQQIIHRNYNHHQRHQQHQQENKHSSININIKSKSENKFDGL